MVRRLSARTPISLERCRSRGLSRSPPATQRANSSSCFSGLTAIFSRASRHTTMRTSMAAPPSRIMKFRSFKATDSISAASMEKAMIHSHPGTRVQLTFFSLPPEGSAAVPVGVESMALTPGSPGDVFQQHLLVRVPHHHALGGQDEGVAGGPDAGGFNVVGDELVQGVGHARAADHLSGSVEDRGGDGHDELPGGEALGRRGAESFLPGQGLPARTLGRPDHRAWHRIFPEPS